jgi:hypothetical protein
MKLETKIYADALLSEVRQYVKREIAEAKSTRASASCLAEALSRIAVLEARLEALERAKTKVVRLAA